MLPPRPRGAAQGSLPSNQGGLDHVQIMLDTLLKLEPSRYPGKHTAALYRTWEGTFIWTC